MNGTDGTSLCFQLTANLPRSKSRVRIPCPALFLQQTAPLKPSRRGAFNVLLVKNLIFSPRKGAPVKNGAFSGEESSLGRSVIQIEAALTNFGEIGKPIGLAQREFAPFVPS
jgi:hypothetical protein